MTIISGTDLVKLKKNNNWSMYEFIAIDKSGNEFMLDPDSLLKLVEELDFEIINGEKYNILKPIPINMTDSSRQSNKAIAEKLRNGSGDLEYLGGGVIRKKKKDATDDM